MAKRDEKPAGYDNLAHGINDSGLTAEEEAKQMEKERKSSISESEKEARQAERSAPAETGPSKEANS